jgi:hypothetical protein
MILVTSAGTPLQKKLRAAICDEKHALDAAVYHLINGWWLLKIFLHSEGIFSLLIRR